MCVLPVSSVHRSMFCIHIDIHIHTCIHITHTYYIYKAIYLYLFNRITCTHAVSAPYSIHVFNWNARWIHKLSFIITFWHLYIFHEKKWLPSYSRLSLKLPLLTDRRSLQHHWFYLCNGCFIKLSQFLYNTSLENNPHNFIYTYIKYVYIFNFFL